MLTSRLARPVRTRAAEARWQVWVPADTHPYWIELLRRGGIPARTFDGTIEGSLEASILFLAGFERAPAPALLARIQAWSQQGVPIVADGRWAAALTGRSLRTVEARGITGRGKLFAGCGAIRFEAQVAVLDGARDARVWPAGVAAVAVLDQPGPVVVLPLPDPDALLRAAPRLISFAQGPVGAACEIVAGSDHGALRRLVENTLRLVCFERGLPFLHLGHVPNGHAGALAVRIDADGFDADATRSTLAALSASHLRATWFIDVERHAKQGGASSIAGIAGAGHEVESHLHHHYTYRSFRKNRANLRRSTEVLRRWGVETSAAAAPFGTWNGALERAFAEARLDYSSEFSRAFDDLPCRLPAAGARRSAAAAPVWQVPIHPVSPILLFEAGFDEQAVHAYFEARLRASLQRGEPAVFYGHPVHDLERCPRLFPHLDATLGAWRSEQDLGPWRCTLGELYAFHRERDGQTVECRIEGGRLQGETAGPAALWIEREGSKPLAVHGRFADSSEPARPQDPVPPVPEQEGESEPREWSASVRRARRSRQRWIEWARLAREVRG